MCAADSAGDVDPHSNCQPPAKGDVRVAALVKQHDHGNHAVAKQNENHRSQELRDELGGKRIFHGFQDNVTRSGKFRVGLADEPGDRSPYSVVSSLDLLRAALACVLLARRAWLATSVF